MENEENIKKLLQTICKPVTPSLEFKERLLKELTLEASHRAVPARQKLWLKPMLWAPVTALVALAVVGYFVLLPLLSVPVTPLVTAPPPTTPSAPSPTLPLTPIPTEPPTTPPTNLTPSSPAPPTVTTPAPSPEPTPAPTPPPTSTIPAEVGNFRLLISDEANAIDHFASVNVTISSIGIQEAGDSGTWHTFDLIPPAEVDLRPLEGENALEIWSGQLAEAEYTKVFIYVDNVTGILEAGGEADAKLPSNKLQISKPFTLSPDLLINFVFDVTVVEAGESGKYILKPQIDQSGPYEPFKLVTPKEKPVVAGKLEKPGKSEKSDRDEDNLALTFEGAAVPGGMIILIVSDDGTPIPAATVMVTIDGEKLMEEQTSTDGRLEIQLPYATGLVKIKAAFEDKGGELEIELEETGNLRITTTHLSHGQIGVDYTATLEATVASESYTWSISEGGLPDGLALDSATGVISGTPTMVGKYSFTVRVGDESAPWQSETQKLSIQIMN